MPKQDIKIHNDFMIYHAKKDGKNIMTIRPATECPEMPQIHIEVTDEQWDTLRYHFATQVNDAEGITRLAYLI